MSGQVVIGIDPGPERSAFVVFDGKAVSSCGEYSNAELMVRLRTNHVTNTALVIEQVACMGMAVGAEVFETVFWSGRFCEAWERPGHNWFRLKRHQVKMHLCGNMRAKDANIRQALVDKFGGKDKAIGRKASPGPLYGISGHCWSALAVAVVWRENYDLTEIEQSCNVTAQVLEQKKSPTATTAANGL